MIVVRKLVPLLSLLTLITSSCSPGPAPERAAAMRLQVGVTLHPYYSWVANVARDLPMDVIAVLPGEVDAGSYQPSPEDVGKLTNLDAIVVNGIGHDDFIEDMIRAAGNTRVVRIRPNEVTTLIPARHGGGPNSHTFLSFDDAILQTTFIAGQLAKLRPEWAEALKRNAAAYTERLRSIRSATAVKLGGAKIRRVVTVHDGYSYLMKEFGIDIAGIVEPAHGLIPSAKELTEMIELIRKDRIQVVFSEESFPERLLQTLRESTGARVYIISHIAVGDYAAEEFEKRMSANADVLVQALATDAR